MRWFLLVALCGCGGVDGVVITEDLAMPSAHDMSPVSDVGAPDDADDADDLSDPQPAVDLSAPDLDVRIYDLAQQSTDMATCAVVPACAAAPPLCCNGATCINGVCLSTVGGPCNNITGPACFMSACGPTGKCQ